MNEECEIVEIFNVDLEGTEEFYDASAAAYQMLENIMKDKYCSVYTAKFQKTATMYSDARGELTE